ncbi:MAG: hypothetical protein P4L99_02010 [Chthoniobacter sp.]|nr:hypothetical protein [Chthoniobacter sp.]
MTTKRGLIVIAAGGAVGLLGLGALALAWGFGFLGGGPLLPLYQLVQTASSHPGYLRTTLTHGNDVYVNDFEEAALRTVDSEPRPAIGRMGIGVDNVRAIPGQPVTAYIAEDAGSEMPAYEVFRNTRQAPFDWRTATFRAMTFPSPSGARASATTTDPALLAEVVRVLRDGTPAGLPAMSLADSSKLGWINMVSDSLPGLEFCPMVYTDATGTVYLAEGLMIDFKASPPQANARWIPVSPTLLQWLK